MKRPKKRYLTTEQLADEVIRCIEKQTPEEKKAVRAELQKAFGNQRPAVQSEMDIQAVTLDVGCSILIDNLAGLPSRTKMWLRFYKVRN
jgi:hypothetical protein